MRLLPLLLTALPALTAGPSAAHAASAPLIMPLPAGAVADCVRDAGDGRLQVVRGGDRARPRIDLVSLSDAAAPSRSEGVSFGHLTDCPEVSGAPGTAPLFAAAVLRGLVVEQRVADAGAAPVKLSATSVLGADLDTGTVVANGAGGTAAVVWQRVARGGRTVLLVARRAGAETAFAPPRALERDAVFRTNDAALVAVDAQGRTTVVWQGGEREGKTLLRVARAERGAPFGPTQTLGPVDRLRPALAVAADGRALVSATRPGGRVGLWESQPDGGSFAPVAVAAGKAVDTAVALGPDGGAVLSVLGSRGVAVFRRATAAGPFSPAQTIPYPRVRRASTEPRSILTSVSSAAGLLDDRDEGDHWLAARVAPSGRFAVTWLIPARGAEPATADSVAGTLAAGIEERTRLGSPCRTVTSATPVVLPDGQLVTTWSDAARVQASSESETDRGEGRIGVVVPGAPAAAQPQLALPVPAVRAEPVDDRPIGAGEPLRLRVSCSGGPCDVRASAWAKSLRRPTKARPTIFGASFAVAASTTLREGETQILSLPVAQRGVLVAPGRSGRPRIAVSVCRAGEPVARRAVIAPRVRMRALAGAPRIAELRARPVGGGRLRVTWRLARPADRGSRFMLVGDRGYRFGRASAGRMRFATTAKIGPTHSVMLFFYSGEGKAIEEVELPAR